MKQQYLIAGVVGILSVGIIALLMPMMPQAEISSEKRPVQSTHSLMDHREEPAQQVIAAWPSVQSPQVYYETQVRTFDTSDGRAQQVAVLLYHHLLPEKINPFPDNAAVLNLEVFETHMSWLQENGYTALTLKELERFLLGELEVPEKSVLITFDDGYASEFHYAAEVLRRQSMAAASFPITSLIQDSPQPFNPQKLTYTSWDQMTLMRDVFEFASHSHDLHHLKNDQSLLITEPLPTVYDDVALSLSLLSAPYFAYPYGHKDQPSVDLLQELGIRMAFTTQPGYATIRTDPMRVPRFSITPWMTLHDFIEIMKHNG